MKYCINERYYLIDKCNLIKDTFIMTLNKKTSIYGSIGYFNKKQETNYSKQSLQKNFKNFMLIEMQQKIY